MSSAEAIRPATKSETVTRRSRSGVIHLKLRVPSQARVPLTAAPVAIADAMHCMHTQPV